MRLPKCKRRHPSAGPGLFLGEGVPTVRLRFTRELSLGDPAVTPVGAQPLPSWAFVRSSAPS